MSMKIDNKNTKTFNKVKTKWHAVSTMHGQQADFDAIFQAKEEALRQPIETIIEKTTKNEIQENQDKEENNFDNQDLSNQDFSNQDLSGASFKNANLTGVDFTNANLNGADFSGAKLDGVTLKDADIENAIMLGISIDDLGLEELQALIEYLAKYYPHKLNLSLLNLALLDLKRIDLSKLNLRGIDFTGCDMTGVNILDLDLSSCIISPEQIRQALGRLPTNVEMAQMFTPRRAKSKGPSELSKIVEGLLRGDGRDWGTWDATRDSGVAVEKLMKFGKKVYKTLSGKPSPDMDSLQHGIQKNIESREKERNEDKKKAIEEKKREILEKMQANEQANEKDKQNFEAEKEVVREKIVTKEINPQVFEITRGRERG